MVFFVIIIQTILIVLRILRLFLFMWRVEHRYLNFPRVFLGNRGLINEVVSYLFFLFILISNFRLGCYNDGGCHYKENLKLVVTSPQTNIFTKIPLWSANLQKYHSG